jgi:hypothetical protein
LTIRRTGSPSTFFFLRALRANDINIMALHSHLIGETPRLFFMHFWANDDAVKLARLARRPRRHQLAQTLTAAGAT